MHAKGRLARPPVVLIVNDQEWSARALESILAPNGYAVLRAYTGRNGLEQARRDRPDLIVVAAGLPDMDGLSLCRLLRGEAHLSASTPIIMTAAGRPTREERLAALLAGAWDYLGFPLDGEELPLRFDAYVAAKYDADAAREGCLLDAVTGLYSMAGLALRARELGSRAYRKGGSLACVVFGAETESGERTITEPLLQRFGRMLRARGRLSDAIGRIGQTEIAVFAPDTDATGAATLAGRIAHAFASEFGPDGHVQLRTGLSAVDDVRAAGVQPHDVLERASAALRVSRQSGATEQYIIESGSGAGSPPTH